MGSDAGLKYDDEKLRYDLIPIEAIEGLAAVFTYGAVKYTPNGWKTVRPKDRYYAAAMRHLAEMRKGEWLDPESGLPHIDHAITSLVMYREITLNGEE